jgi:hypothetical protein
MEALSMTREELQTNHAPLFAEILEEGRQAGAAAALAEERTRVAAVLAVPAVGHSALVQTALTDGTTAERLSLRILQAEQTQRSQHLEDSAAESRTVPGSEAAAAGTNETRALIAAAVTGGSVA